VVIDSRFLAAAPGGTNAFALRWFGATNANYRVEWSENLTTWAGATSLPTHLGQGIFQWLNLTEAGRCFYRVVRLP
jgi:hypothetical protein